MRLRSPSRTGGKQKKALRLFKRLEFIFRDTDSLTSILSLRERRTTQSPGQGQISPATRDVNLELKARGLLCKLGAHKLAREIRVQWNPRMRTCAGRADYREKLVSLNPLLLDARAGLAANKVEAKSNDDRKLDRFKQSSLTNVTQGSLTRSESCAAYDEVDRTLRHELAHLLAQWRAGRRRIAPHGIEWRQACRDLGIANEARCHNLPFASKAYERRYVYRCPHCKEEFPRVRRIRRATACLACCRKHNGGDFDPRFRLKRDGHAPSCP